MATTTDPVEALAATVNRLYDLSGSDGIEANQQKQLAQQADSLSDELSRLVGEQLDATSAVYHPLMLSLTETTNALNQAEAKIQGLVSKVNGIADVAAAVDDLIKQATALATSAAKLAV